MPLSLRYPKGALKLFIYLGSMQSLPLTVSWGSSLPLYQFTYLKLLFLCKSLGKICGKSMYLYSKYVQIKICGQVLYEEFPSNSWKRSQLFFQKTSPTALPNYSLLFNPGRTPHVRTHKLSKKERLCGWNFVYIYSHQITHKWYIRNGYW